MTRRKKYRGEPDYRFYPYNVIKNESRAIFKSANGCISALILLFAAFLACGFLGAFGSPQTMRSSSGSFSSLVCLGFIGSCLFALITSIIQRNAKKRVEALAQNVIEEDRLDKERHRHPNHYSEPKPASTPRSSAFSSWRVANKHSDSAPVFDMDDLPNFYELTPTEFEHEVAALFRRMARSDGKPVRAEVVGKSGDGGIDIRLRSHAGMLVGIVQVKRYDPSKTLDPGALRELDSVRKNLGVHKAYLVTTARFSVRTIETAADMKINLIDGTKFSELWRKTFKAQSSPAPTTYKPQQSTQYVSPTPTPQSPAQSNYQPEVVHKGGTPIAKQTPLTDNQDAIWGNLTEAEKFAERQRRKNQGTGS